MCRKHRAGSTPGPAPATRLCPAHPTPTWGGHRPCPHCPRPCGRAGGAGPTGGGRGERAARSLPVGGQETSARQPATPPSPRLPRPHNGRKRSFLSLPARPLQGRATVCVTGPAPGPARPDLPGAQLHGRPGGQAARQGHTQAAPRPGAGPWAPAGGEAVCDRRLAMPARVRAAAVGCGPRASPHGRGLGSTSGARHPLPPWGVASSA